MEREPSNDQEGRRVLTKKERSEVATLFRAGVRAAVLAERYSVSRQTIYTVSKESAPTSDTAEADRLLRSFAASDRAEGTCREPDQKEGAA